MTKGEINLLYSELENLLNDICTFLREEIGSGCMSNNGRAIANTLIERSKRQLQTISIVTTSATSECVNEPYVDMQSYKGNQEFEENQEVYSDICLASEKMSNSMLTDDEFICPYANLSAAEIKEGKTGHLYRKEKFVFIELQKKIYATVQESWFLIYMNESALKPYQTFNLCRYEAKPSSVPIKDIKKRDESFELFHTANFKSYQFTALTAKDMMQWVACINRQSEKQSTPKRDLPPVPPESPPTSPVDLDVDETFLDSSNDYEPLKEYQLKKENTNKPQTPMGNKNKIPKQPIPLPPRNTVPPRVTSRLTMPSPPEVPSPPSRIASQESLSSDYDSVEPTDSHSVKNTPSSFSDDSDTYYDNPSDLKNRLIASVQPKNEENARVVKEEENEDEIYDYLQNPIRITKPQPLTIPSISQKVVDVKTQNESSPIKPKPNVKPKLLSFRPLRKNNV